VNNFAFNFFDLLLVAVLVTGLVQGRKRGMSGEVVSLFRWLAILLGCAAIYQPLGQLVAQAGVFSLQSAYLLVYLGALLVVLLAFSLAERELRPKLEGSDLFGEGEYYLGMASGLVRACCVLLVSLALLNGPTFTPTDVKRMDAFQDAAFGSPLFPTLHSLQAAVFENSLCGPWIRRDLGFLLIQPTEPEPTEPVKRKALATSHSPPPSR
jgi:hypothetical protein